MDAMEFFYRLTLMLLIPEWHQVPEHLSLAE
jgi:hypothetical protein